MQSGIQFEKIPSRAPRKPGDALNETLRLVRRDNRTSTQKIRRQARRVANRLKGRV